MPINMPHLKSLASPFTIYIYFANCSLPYCHIPLSHWDFVNRCYCSLHKIAILLWISLKNCNIYFTSHCHICSSHKYTPQMPHIFHICKLIMFIYETAMSIYRPHMNSVESTMSPGTLMYILHFQAYAPGQIWLSHCTCMSQ